jgi:hypothetical protein
MVVCSACTAVMTPSAASGTSPIETKGMRHPRSFSVLRVRHPPMLHDAGLAQATRSSIWATHVYHGFASSIIGLLPTGHTRLMSLSVSLFDRERLNGASGCCRLRKCDGIGHHSWVKERKRMTRSEMRAGAWAFIRPREPWHPRLVVQAVACPADFAATHGRARRSCTSLNRRLMASARFRRLLPESDGA